LAAEVIYLKNRKPPDDRKSTPSVDGRPEAPAGKTIRADRIGTTATEHYTVRRRGPTPAQRAWLARGLDQAGGKLPLFDANGQRVNSRTIRACLKRGWAEPWFANPVKPDWLVCKLTESGRAVLRGDAPED